MSWNGCSSCSRFETHTWQFICAPGTRDSRIDLGDGTLGRNLFIHADLPIPDALFHRHKKRNAQVYCQSSQRRVQNKQEPFPVKGVEMLTFSRRKWGVGYI
jgi:hypothetical protein